MPETSFSDPAGERHLELFVKSELAGFNERDFELLASYHAPDVLVQMPDGSVVKGVGPHMQDLKDMLVWAPDFRVEEHITKVAAGDWTAVVSRVTGTFSELAPTGKTLRLQVANVARWQGGKIAQESLFWDGASFQRQLGLA